MSTHVSRRPARARAAGVLFALAGVVALARPAAADNEGSFCTFMNAGSLLTLNGNAAYSSNLLRLVPNATNQAGSAYLASPITVAGTTSFHTHFRMVFGNGGEGMTFVIQGSGSNALGSNGAGLGYTGIGTSVAVEFDTHQDAAEDANGNHVAVRTNGSTTTLATTATGVPTMNNATIDAWIDYDGTANEIKVFVASTNTKPASPVIDYVGLDLTGVGSSGYVGFTASTGSATKNSEDVSYFVFTTGSSLLECTSCTTQATCTSLTFTPVCDTNRQQCVECTNDLGGGTLACTASGSPACQKSGSLVGQCTQCSTTYENLCSGTTPVCDPSTGVCGGCNGDNGLPVTRACLTAAKPSCQIDGSCTQCSASKLGNCTGTTPTCDSTGTCAACNADNGKAGTDPCPSASTPACEASGACGQCSSSNLDLCSGNTPTCNLGTTTCAACNDDHGGSNSRPCPQPGTPACQVAGSCTVCSASNLSLCNGQTPTCAPNGTCTGCTADFGGTGQTCATSANPFCFLSGGQTGACGKCAQSSDCVGHPAGNVCNTVSGSCGTSCAIDGDCSSDKWCLSNVCTPKTPNGQPVPASAGACDAAVGLRVCTTGVCDTGDGLCGLPNGAVCQGPSDAGAADAATEAGADAGDAGGPTAVDLTCRSSFCAPDGKCGRPTGTACTANNQCRSAKCDVGKCVECTNDSDCGGATSGRVCDDTSGLCIDGCRGAFGNGCPGGQLCSSSSITIGSCSPPPDAGGPEAGPGDDGGSVADASVADAAIGADASPIDEEGELRGGALSCASAPGAGSAAGLSFPLLALVGLLLRRKKRR